MSLFSRCPNLFISHFLSDLIIFSLFISTPSLPFQKLEVKSVVKSDVKWSLLWLGSLNSNSLGPLMAPVTSKGARPPGQPSGQPCGLWSPSLGQPPNPMGVPGLHSTQTLSQMWHTRPPRVPRTLRAPLRLGLPPSASEITPICVPLPGLPWKSSTRSPPPTILWPWAADRRLMESHPGLRCRGASYLGPRGSFSNHTHGLVSKERIKSTRMIKHLSLHI